MKHGLFLTVLLLWASTVRADSLWNSLWLNADQQGERLMQQGDAQAAAQTYTDPRRKAYAELQAGNFVNAAKLFSAFDDSNGNYNRGNALAQAGHLEEAIQAYDAALKHDPNDKDARHNRELLVKALQQRSPSHSSSDKNSLPKESKNGEKNQSGQEGQAENKNSGMKSTENNKTQANDVEQAKRDAAVTLNKSAAGNSGKHSEGSISEQQLAQDQWLRAIPDDPGGLLRRKFMIEHMIRQQGQ